MRKRVLIVDDLHPVIVEKLNGVGFSCDYEPEISKKEVLERLKDYQGLVLRSKLIIDSYVIDMAPKLKFVGRAGSGLENVDVEYAKTKGIACFNSPEGNRDSVAEHAIGMLLSLTNKIIKANIEVKQGIWNRNENWGTELKGKTIGIIGYGNMGSAFAKRLSGFDVNILTFDKYKKNYSDSYVTETDMATIFKMADILSLHIPLTDETRYLVDGQFIESFEKRIILINTSRGKIVKTTDLVQKLKQGKIVGAALDVNEYESSSFEKFGCVNLPEAFEFLSNANNVILTPHIAGWSNESYFKISEVLADKIISHFGK